MNGLRKVTLVGICISFCLLIAVLLMGLARAEGEADIAECVVTKSQVIKRDCQHVDESFDGGCGQYLASHDPARNWISRDHQHCSGPAMGFLGVCDGVCEEAFRGGYRARGQDFVWDIFKMTVYPASAARFLRAPNPMAVPPDRAASSQYVTEWNCDRENPLVPITGAYAKQFIWGEIAGDPLLWDLAELDFTLWPEYWDAYNSVGDGYAAVRGYAHNPHPSGSLDSNTEAWKKRWAIFDIMATGPAVNPKPSPEQPWWAAVQICEYMILTYFHPDAQRKQDLGFWASEHPALTAAIDQIYLLTDGRVSAAYDPRMLFWDVDVARELTTWGAIKASFR